MRKRPPSRPRDHRGWLVPEPGTKAREVYDLLDAGESREATAAEMHKRYPNVVFTRYWARREVDRIQHPTEFNGRRWIESERDERGWLVPRSPGSKIVYDLLAAGASLEEIITARGGARARCSVLATISRIVGKGAVAQRASKRAGPRSAAFEKMAAASRAFEESQKSPGA